MFTNTFLFPDVNVWLALAHARHPHYEVANEWIESLGNEIALHFCRFTQLGLLRLLTAPAAMGDEAMTQAGAWKVYDLFFRDVRVRFIDEPRQVEACFRQKTNRREVSTKQWADGYLAAFAEAGGLRLVTFDKALAKQAAESALLGLT